MNIIGLLAAISQISISIQVVESASSHGCSPIPLDEGKIIKCRRPNSAKITNCNGNYPPGTIVYFRCKRFYREFSTSIFDLKCDSTGNWNKRDLRYYNRKCQLDCGNTLNFQNTDNFQSENQQSSSPSASTWPWHVAIFIKFRDSKFYYACGGTLIHIKTVLTAAHCFTRKDGKLRPFEDFQIVLGTNSSMYPTLINDSSSLQIFSVKEVYIPEYHDSVRLDSDIAIIALERNVVLSREVLPACLPNDLDVSIYQLKEGDIGHVAGFGRSADANSSDANNTAAVSDFLKFVQIKVSKPEVCQNDINFLPASSQFCGEALEGKIVIGGDSGGGVLFPRVISRNFPTRYYVQGIVSYGRKVASTYAVYSNVLPFLDWIEKVERKINNISEPLPPGQDKRPFAPSGVADQYIKSIAGPKLTNLLREELMGWNRKFSEQFKNSTILFTNWWNTIAPMNRKINITKAESLNQELLNSQINLEDPLRFHTPENRREILKEFGGNVRRYFRIWWREIPLERKISSLLNN